MSSEAYRRVVIMTETPESKQPFSMMHRALYANIVGHETLYAFPHGCTIKQFNGEDYVVDHVTRLARPISMVPGLTAHEPANIKKAGEYHNGITKCRDVLANLQSRIKIGQTHLLKSAAVIEKHEATLRAMQERKAAQAAAAAAAPIAGVISQRCQELTTVRALLSLVAQALRAANAEHVRFLKQNQLDELQRVAPALYQRYVSWRNGQLPLLERADQQPQADGTYDALPAEDDDLGGHSDASADADADADAEGADVDVEGGDDAEGDADADAEVADNDNDNDSGEADLDDAEVDGDGDGSEGDEEEGEENSGGDAPVEDPDMDDEILMPGSSTTHELLTARKSKNSTPRLAPAEPAEAPAPAVEDSNVPAEGSEAEEAPAVAAVASEVVAVEAAPREREEARTLYLPECGQADICVFCTLCQAYLRFDAADLAEHEASAGHALRRTGEAVRSGVTFLGHTTPPTPLPSYTTHRAIPKRHVRVEEDNSFADAYTVVRSGCTSCRKDVPLGELIEHGTSQEHLDFLEE